MCCLRYWWVNGIQEIKLEKQINAPKMWTSQSEPVASLVSHSDNKILLSLNCKNNKCFSKE